MVSWCRKPVVSNVNNDMPIELLQTNIKPSEKSLVGHEIGFKRLLSLAPSSTVGGSGNCKQNELWYAEHFQDEQPDYFKTKIFFCSRTATEYTAYCLRKIRMRVGVVGCHK